ncbi:MAG: flagellar basal body-associated FliL family protein [Pseudomonadota bacterium]
MADEDLDLDLSGDGADGVPKKSKKLLIIIIVAVFILLIGAGAGMYFMGIFDKKVEQTAEGQATEESVNKKAAKEEEELAEDAIYWPVEPPFVMNFEGKSKAKYMQIGLVIMSRSQKSINTLKKHMPAIRNELTFLLGSQKYVEMRSPEGKEQLRSEIVESINNILKANGAGSGIEKALFTSFVMQ